MPWPASARPLRRPDSAVSGEWLDRGYAGEMRYLAIAQSGLRTPATRVWTASAVSVMLAMPYRTAEPQAGRARSGQVSRYAWGQRLSRADLANGWTNLAAWLAAESPGCRVRGVVDTAPLLEREFAQLAGLGWVGKNTLLLNQELGSWFFLGGAVDRCGA